MPFSFKTWKLYYEILKRWQAREWIDVCFVTRLAFSFSNSTYVIRGNDNNCHSLTLMRSVTSRSMSRLIWSRKKKKDYKNIIHSFHCEGANRWSWTQKCLPLPTKCRQDPCPLWCIRILMDFPIPRYVKSLYFYYCNCATFDM